MGFLLKTRNGHKTKKYIYVEKVSFCWPQILSTKLSTRSNKYTSTASYTIKIMVFSSYLKLTLTIVFRVGGLTNAPLNPDIIPL